jgi:hypothetical protein
MTPEQEEEAEEEKNEEAEDDGQGDTTSKSAKNDAQSSAAEGEEKEEEQDKGPVNPMLIMDEVVNDHLDKAAELPPKDPEGQNTLMPDLIITEERIIGILDSALNIVCEWIKSEMGTYNAKVKAEGRTL